MSIRIIKTENAWEEQWSILSRLTYPDNIRRHLGKRFPHPIEDVVVNFIAGSLRQGEEYLRSARASTMDTAPLLTYYGITNLLLAGVALNSNNRPIGINHHGLCMKPRTDERLSSIEVQPCNHSFGAFQYLSRHLSHSADVGHACWSLGEVFRSIPELRNVCREVYPGETLFSIPVGTGETDDLTFEWVSSADVLSLGIDATSLFGLEAFSKMYIQPQQRDHRFILFKKLDAVQSDIISTSIQGEKSFLIPHKKKHGNLLMPPLSLTLIASFALGMLSRYHPDMWHPFVVSDITGERCVAEHFCKIVQRMIPNLVINLLEEEQVYFRAYPEPR